MTTRLYEGMFLVDSNWASRSMEEVSEVIAALVQKHGGTVRRGEKWDDRKLAYPIRIERTIHRRGTYYLTSLDLPPEGVREILREIELDPRLLRAIILVRRPDEEEDIFAPFPEVEDPRRGGRSSRDKTDEGASDRSGRRRDEESKDDDDESDDDDSDEDENDDDDDDSDEEEEDEG